MSVALDDLPPSGIRMHRFSLTQLTDGTLRQSSLAIHSVERSNTALAVAHLGEVEARGLHLPWGFASISAYAVEELRLSADAAYNRIRVARKAREFPALFEALEQGELSLASIRLLAPHLTAENADALIREASGRSRSEIESLLISRASSGSGGDLFAAANGDTLVPGRVEPAGENASPPASVATPTTAPNPVPTRTSPIGILPATREKLQRLRELLAHQVPSGNLAEVLDRTCEIALRQMERRKYATTHRPRAARQSSDPRCIPAEVRRAVRARDGGRCAFVGEDGHPCASRSRLEFDHVVPVARGGRATVDNVRLLCRAHNQFVAETIFGKEFMAGRRPAARSNVSKGVPDGAKQPGRVVIEAKFASMVPESLPDRAELESAARRRSKNAHACCSPACANSAIVRMKRARPRSSGSERSTSHWKTK